MVNEPFFGAIHKFRLPLESNNPLFSNEKKTVEMEIKYKMSLSSEYISEEGRIVFLGIEG